MKTTGQLWVARRINDIIPALENSTRVIDPIYYPDFSGYLNDVLDETLSNVFTDDGNAFDSDSFNNKYSSVISALTDMFGEKLSDYYDSYHTNQQTINESDVNRNITALEKHWRKQQKSGKQIRFDKDELEMWGITKRSDKMKAQLLFQELVGDEAFATKFIKTLLNKTFSTKDFSDRIVGGYDFEWTITQMNYQDYDFFLYGQTLPGGTVSMFNGRNLTLVEALEDEDIGWEIQQEVNDVVQDCMNEIILPATGYDVEVPVIYIAEE